MQLLMLDNIHRLAVGHVFRIGDRVTFYPRLDQTAIGVLVNRRDRRLFRDDLLQFVVIRRQGRGAGFTAGLRQQLVVIRALEFGDIAAVGGAQQRQEGRSFIVIAAPRRNCRCCGCRYKFSIPDSAT